jgi:hypothetical protein
MCYQPMTERVRWLLLALLSIQNTVEHLCASKGPVSYLELLLIQKVQASGHFFFAQAGGTRLNMWPVAAVCAEKAGVSALRHKKLRHVQVLVTQKHVNPALFCRPYTFIASIQEACAADNSPSLLLLVASETSTNTSGLSPVILTTPSAASSLCTFSHTRVWVMVRVMLVRWADKNLCYR